MTPNHALASDELIGGGPLVRPSVSASTLQRTVAAAIVPMVAVTIWLAATSEHLERPEWSALYVGLVTAASMATGLYWWMRRPASRFGPLLVAFGTSAWMISWQFSDWPLVFDVGVLAEAPSVLLTFYLFLAFPMGRIEPRAARWLMALLALVIVSFYLIWPLFAPVIAGSGALVACGTACPENVLQIASFPSLVDAASEVETYGALSITVAVLGIYVSRLLAASRPQMRALVAVAVTSLLFLPAFFVFHFSRLVLEVGPETLDSLQWGLVATRILLPLGFLVALLQAEAFAAGALRTLVERLAGRPTPAKWRQIVAAALDDPALRLGYHDPRTGRLREPDGDELAPPPSGSGRRWVAVDRDGRQVAAMVIDETLAEDPELVRAAATATLLAVENGALEGELRASRARILEAGQAERRRIERDLHDSAQQRLVALRIHLTLTGERLGRPEERAMLDQLGLEVDETIDDLRNLSHGLYPQTLAQDGVGAALALVARRSAMAVRVEDRGLGRHSRTLEMTIYFCCLECLQNAGKHAGAGTSVSVRLDEANGRIRFCIEDDGIGFDPGSVERGDGLTNVADRVAAVGGELQVESSPGRGTRITGEVPV